HRASGSCLKRTVWYVFIMYVAFVSLFTCPGSPGHPVCQVGSLVKTSVVAPVHSLALGTETGARIDAAYKAHLVPFYEKHGAPVVTGAQLFASDTVVPALKKAVQPASDAVSRIASPHVAKVCALYAAYAKPTVDTVGSAAYGAMSRFIIPVTSTVLDRSTHCVKVYVVPFGRSAVNDYVVPFYSNHVHPRWNHQIKPALCRYSKVAVEYTRTSVFPAIADGATYGYRVSHDFAAAHVVPHSKRVAIHVYSFLAKSVYPPVYSVYEKTLKPHVDRVVPWDKVQVVSGRVSTAVCASLEVGWSFLEELYFMGYTILTGKEHPAVIERLRVVAEEASRKDSGLVGSIKDRVLSDSTADGQIQHMARRVSGSARQWVQVARGWLGSAVGSAKDGVASYKSRFEQTAYIQYSEATSVAGAVTEIVGSLAHVASSNVLQETAEPEVSTATSIAEVHEASTPLVVESIVEEVKETVVSSVLEDLSEQTSQSDYASVTEHTEEATPVVEPVVESAIESVVEPVIEPVVEVLTDVIAAITLEEEKDTDPVEVESAVESSPSVVPVAKPVVLERQQPAETPVVVVVKEPVESAVNDDEPSSPEPEETTVVVSEAEEEEEKKIVPKITTVISIVERPVLKKASSTSEKHVEEPAVETSEPAKIIPIAAEEAASAIYDAREAMAGVVLDKDDVSKFEELVKSATEVTENLEAFPSVVADTEEHLAETSAVAPEKPEATPEDNTLGPEDVVESPVAVVKKPVEADVPPVPASNENDMLSVTTTVPEPKEEQPISDDIPVIEEDKQQPIADEVPVVVEEKQVQATPESQAQDSTVDEDVRKSASNWVKDARKSISKELAEERTRAGPLVVDDDDAAPASPKVEQVVPAAPPQEPVAEDTAVPPASEPVPEHVPEMVVQEQPERVVEIPKVEDQKPHPESPAKASKTQPADANVAKTAASKSEMSDAAAPVPAPGEQKDSVDGSGTATAEKQTPPLKRFKKPATVMATPTDDPKGPRKVKKTKKRVVKKTAASESDTSLD
ncbi:hypothetical protein LPJ81_003353, partial [Coemansia sp. IMI 209127]